MKQWASLGTEVMRDARKAKGWSYETVARKIHVSSKSYERYEKGGVVPVDMVDLVADVLDLEIERPDFKRVVTLPAEQDPDEPTWAASLRSEVASNRELLERIEGGLEAAGLLPD